MAVHLNAIFIKMHLSDQKSGRVSNNNYLLGFQLDILSSVN